LFILALLLVTFALFFSNEVRNAIFRNTQIDTIGHFIGFFCLTWILSSFVKLSTPALTMALVIYAGLSELGQYYLGFRNGEIKDFIADLLGIGCFLLFKWIWLVYGHKFKRT